MALNLTGMKENIQTIFEDANTTTAAHDLSGSLTDRVQRILKLNPIKIPVQPSWYPYVTVYVDSKDINPADMAATQLQAKRRAEVDFNVVGAVWNSSVLTESEDDADDECEILMENIEEVLRRNQALGSLALWSFTRSVSYHSLAIDEEAHLRAGILTLRATVLY